MQTLREAHRLLSAKGIKITGHLNGAFSVRAHGHIYISTQLRDVVAWALAV